MARRPLNKAQKPAQERPSMEATLDHYGVEYSPSRASQRILCPVHDERTPSCSLDLIKGLLHCHSCSWGGDAYALIMTKEGIDFGRAVSFAADAGLATGGAGGGSGVGGNGSRYGRRGHGVSDGSRPERGDDQWKPSWRSR